MTNFPCTHFRVARPTQNLSQIIAFYKDGLGLQELGRFTDHNGVKGLILGHKHQSYHLEFTEHDSSYWVITF